MNRWIVGLALVLAASSVFAEKVYTDTQKPITVGRAAHEFTIELKANPTTGYMWFLKGFNDDLLEIEKHYYRPPKDQKPGAPGVSVWKFKVDSDAFEAPQMMSLEFVYTKPWDLSDQKVEKFTVLTTDH